MVSNLTYELMAAVSALGWGLFAHACFTVQRYKDRLDAVRKQRHFWRTRASNLESTMTNLQAMLEHPPVLVDPEGARIIPFRGKVKS